MVGDEHREVQITLNRKSEARLGASSVWFVCRNSGVPSLLTALVLQLGLGSNRAGFDINYGLRRICFSPHSSQVEGMTRAQIL